MNRSTETDGKTPTSVALGYIQAAYGQDWKGSPTLQVWQDSLFDLDEALLPEAARLMVQTVPDFPTPAKFRAAYQEVIERRRYRPAEEVLALTEPVASPEASKAAIADILEKLRRKNAENPGRKRWA